MKKLRLDSCSGEAELCNTAKKPKRVEIDRISGLSDDLIALILSFLSTKDAIATSVLSKRWRSLSALVPVLNFSSRSSEENRSFLRFFRKRVKTLEGSLAVVRLQGKFGPYFGDWVSKTIECGVRELDISITGARPIKIFRHGSLTSTTLVSLRLEKVFFDVPLSVHLPYLKILHLKEVGDVSKESISRFIFGCPVVEYVLISKYSRQSLKLPLSLFTSQTLVSLNLGYGVSLDLPSFIHLAHLKMVKLDRRKCMSHESISQFLLGCTSLEELSLWVADGKPLKVPERLFISKTPVSLKLRGSISLHAPPSVCLPSLRILHLGGSAIVLEDLLGDLLSGCPVLEEIYLGSLPITNEEPSSMYLPLLERLTVCLRSKHHPLALNLKITAPALKHFRILCGLPYGEIAWNFPNLQEASVSIEQNIPRKVFSTIKNTKVLKLQHCCFGGISVPLDVNLIPEFQHLEHLEIENPVSLAYLLPEILESSTNLQKLIIFDKKASHDVVWYTPRNVPHCLLHSLKEFSIHCFEGLNKEMQMVDYILTNAHVLEEIRVGFFALDAEQKLRAQEKLSAIPRSSRMSRLEFI